VEAIKPESIDKAELLFGILSESLQRYGRLSSEHSPREVEIYRFEAPKQQATFEVALSEINRHRIDQIIDLAHVLIEHHLKLILDAIEREDFPDTVSGRMASWITKRT
jgi:hypothetical protein